MKIAVDVKGTLEGHKRAQIIRMMMFLQDAGHEIVIWSNSYGFAVDALKKMEETPLEAMTAESKTTTWDTEERFDIAIEDDRSQTYLAARNFIWVDEIPTDTPISFLKDKLKEFGHE